MLSALEYGFWSAEEDTVMALFVSRKHAVLVWLDKHVVDDVRRLCVGNDRVTWILGRNRLDLAAFISNVLLS
jgi:hypothetical protein